MTPISIGKDRIIFLDNLRYLMVLLVIVLHAAISYSNFAPWWSVKEVHEHAVFFDIVLLLFDVFLMPILFFIAGYFAISSFQKKGAVPFLKRKLRRLGLPLLLGVPLISPVFYYIHHYTRFGPPRSMKLSEVWVGYMKGAGDLQFGLIQTIDQFSQNHLWFMSLLLFFFFMFTLAFGNSKGLKAAATNRLSTEVSSKGILFILALVGVLSAVAMFVALILFASPSNPVPWISVGNILQFEASKVVTYVLYFCMGVHAFHNKWFVQARFPGRPAFWAITCIVLSLSHLLIFKQMVLNYTPGLHFGFLCSKSFLCVSFLAAFTTGAMRYWNRPTHLNGLLALNSYHIYIVHFFFVIVIQWALAGWSDISVLLKFAIVSVASIAISFGMSNYAIRPHPRFSVIGIYALFVVMLFTFNPAGI